MANWKYRIDIKTILNRGSDLQDDDVVPADIKAGLVAEVKKAPPIAHYAGRILRATNVRSLNRILNHLYTDADASMVWCGL